MSQLVVPPPLPDFETLRLAGTSVVGGENAHDIEKTTNELKALFSWVSRCHKDLKLPANASRGGPVLQEALALLMGAKHVLATWEVQNFFSVPRRMDVETRWSVAGAGQLYIKVLGASDITLDVSDASSCSLVVEATLAHAVDEAGSQPLVRSQRVDGGLSPPVCAEFVFPMRTRFAPLRLAVLRYRRLSSNTLLADGQLDLRELPPFTLFALAVPLTSRLGKPSSASSSSSSALPSSARLNVLVQFTPMHIATFAPTLLATPRLQVPKSVLQAGETVYGQLHFNASRAMDIVRINVCVLGSAWSRWTEHRGKVRINRAQRSELARPVHMCWQATDPNNPTKLGAGSYVWGFALALPPSLPPSMRMHHGGIEYELCSQTQLRNGKIETLLVPLRVLAPYHGNPGARFGVLVPEASSGDATVKLTGTLNAGVVTPGERYEATLQVANGSSNQVTGLSLAMRGLAVFRAGAHRRQTELANSGMVDYSEGFPVLPGQTKAFTVAFVVPAGLIPTLAQNSPLLQLTHALHVSCKIAGIFSGHARGDIPLVVSQPTAAAATPALYPDAQPAADLIAATGYGLPVYPPAFLSR